METVISDTVKQTMKVVICGDGNVGKTSFVSKLVNGNFITDYIPTIGCVKSKQNEFRYYDTAGVEKFGGLRDGYFIGADYAIIMCDATNLESIRNIQNWHRDLQRVLEYNVPIIVCVNKMDLLSREENMKLQQRLIFRKFNTKFFSVKEKLPQSIIDYLTSYNLRKITIKKNPCAIRFVDDPIILKQLYSDIPEIKKWMTVDQFAICKV